MSIAMPLFVTLGFLFAIAFLVAAAAWVVFIKAASGLIERAPVTTRDGWGIVCVSLTFAAWIAGAAWMLMP